MCEVDDAGGSSDRGAVHSGVHPAVLYQSGNLPLTHHITRLSLTLTGGG